MNASVSNPHTSQTMNAFLTSPGASTHPTFPPFLRSSLPPADTIKYGLSHSKPQALEYEATRFAELAATSVSAALRGIFTGTTALKQSKYGKPAHAIETVAVVGAGLMGAGIAQVSAEKG